MPQAQQQAIADEISRLLSRERYPEAAALLAEFGATVAMHSAGSDGTARDLLPAINFLKSALIATRARRAQCAEELRQSRRGRTYLSTSVDAPADPTLDFTV